MRELLNIRPLLRIDPDINRRDAAGEQIKHRIPAKPDPALRHDAN